MPELSLLQRLQTHARQREARNANQDEIELYLELERALQPESLPELTQQVMAVLPEVQAFNNEGWTVKLALRPFPREDQPHLYTVTLWRLGMGRGIKGSGNVLSCALAAAHDTTMRKLQARAARQLRAANQAGGQQ
jgi:hypothetical protein